MEILALALWFIIGLFIFITTYPIISEKLEDTGFFLEAMVAIVSIILAPILLLKLIFCILLDDDEA